MTKPAQTNKPAPAPKPAAHVKPQWLAHKISIRILWVVGLGIIAALVYGDVYLTPHPYFGLDGSFGFYAWFGLSTCIAMILVAKLLGPYLSRKDTYYDDQ